MVKFWRACFADIWIFCIFSGFNQIVMLGVVYFDNLEHYCFELYDISDLFQSICDVIDDIIQI